MKQVFAAVAFALISSIYISQSFAQDMLGDEIADRFRAQLRSIGAAESDPDLGATRGLVLVPVAPETARAEEPVGGAELTLTPPGEGPAVWTLPRGEQVNVRITFAFDSAALSADQEPRLREVCAGFDQAGVSVMKIIGHTDSSGPADYNQQLSELRAEEVKRFLVDDCGIAPSRLEAVGVGEQFPFDERKPGASVNRRVEFQAVS